MSFVKSCLVWAPWTGSFFFFICIYLVMLVRNLAGNLLGNLFILEDSKCSILGVFGVMLLNWEGPYTVITWPHFVHSWPRHRG